jgi:aryl-alcohol dehydrogenase-like predicted oxidoreductase
MPAFIEVFTAEDAEIAEKVYFFSVCSAFSAVNYNSRPMKYRPLGKTGIDVSEIGFGAWAIGGPVDLFGMPVGWGKVDDADSIAAIHRALDLGVTFFDTADVYGSGHSEELLGEVLHGRECVIATKGGNARTEQSAYKDFSPAYIEQAVERSLKRLNREVIDLYQLHNPAPPVWQSDEIFTLLNRLKSDGKIRASGVSISTMDEGIHLIREGKVDVLQVLFNVLNQEPAKELLPLAQQKGVGIITRVPLASGLLTGKFSADHRFAKDDNRSNYLNAARLKEALQKVDRLKQLTEGQNLNKTALAFLLKFPAVSAVIPGAKTAAQVEQNASASDLEISERLFTNIKSEFEDYNFYIRYKVRV